MGKSCVEPTWMPPANRRKDLQQTPCAAESTIIRAMPVIFRYHGFKFFFYSNEGTPREPAHVHVEKDDMEAKFWLFPEVQVAYNDGYDARMLRELLEIVGQNKGLIERAWDEFFR